MPKQLELEPRYNLPVPRLTVERSGIDIPEAAGKRAARTIGRRRQRVGRNRVVHISAVERVEELRADLERHRFPDTKDSAYTQLFVGTAFIAKVTVIRGSRSPQPSGRIGPGRRIQHEVLGEQRHAGYSIEKSRTEQQGAEIVLCQRNRNGQPARISENPAERPAA